MVSFEKLVSRDVVHLVSTELDLAGVKMSIDNFFALMIIGGLTVFVASSLVLFFALGVFAVVAVLGGIVGGAVFEAVVYAALEFMIDKRKGFVEGILADYLQITAANVRSGMSLDKALVFAARPEFKYFSDDIKLFNEQVYAGETIENALTILSGKYRSAQLKHTVRLIIESIHYGGGITDLLNHIAKDIRSQQLIQREIAGQLFMYSIFIAFAALIGAPALYALTSQMIRITSTVWSGILQQNPGGLPTEGASFLKPTPPQITPQEYLDFAYVSLLVIAGFCAFIISAISSGSPVRGIRYAPAFMIIALVVFLLISFVIGSLFTNIAGV